MTCLYAYIQGQSQWELEGRLQGRIDVPLASSEILSIRKDFEEIEGLGISVIYSGRGQTSLESAGLLGLELKVKTKSSETLNEMDLGLWQGLLGSELSQRHTKTYKRWLENPASVTPPKGETLAGVAERLVDGLSYLARKHSQETVLLVAGRLVIGTLICLVEDRPLDGVLKVLDLSRRLYSLGTGRPAVGSRR